MQLINDQWVEFSKNIIPEDAPPMQKQEMERAFFAGASAVLVIVREFGSEDIPAEKSVEVLASMLKEAVEFAERQICEADYKLMENPIGHG